MPFGKFSGLPLADIPTNYLSWLLSLDLREPLKSGVWSEYRRRVDAQEAPAALDMDRVKRIYRTLAMEFHPDRQGGNGDVMKGINLFYEALQ